MSKWQIFGAISSEQGSEQEHPNPHAQFSGKGVHALSIGDVQKNSNRMIVKEVIVDLVAVTGRQFTVEACCDDSGANAHCVYCIL